MESLLITAAELHVRADLGVVHAAEKTLTPDTLAALADPPGMGGLRANPGNAPRKTG